MLGESSPYQLKLQVKENTHEAIVQQHLVVDPQIPIQASIWQHCSHIHLAMATKPFHLKSVFYYCQTSVLFLYKGATLVDNRAHGHYTLVGSPT